MRHNPCQHPGLTGRFLVGCRLHGIGDHCLGRFAFSKTISGRDHGVGNKAMAVVAQGVAHIAQTTGVVPFAVEPCVGIGAGLVSGIAALLAVKVIALIRVTLIT